MIFERDITKEIKPKGEDYTSFIIEVINKVIGVTQ